MKVYGCMPLLIVQEKVDVSLFFVNNKPVTVVIFYMKIYPLGHFKSKTYNTKYLFHYTNLKTAVLYGHFRVRLVSIFVRKVSAVLLQK